MYMKKIGNINITFPLFVTESHSIYPKILFIKSGGNILLNCSENSGQSVIWRHNKDIYAVGSNVNKNFVQDGKITLTGNHDNGEYNLKVLNVGKTDEGTYWCTSSNGDDVIDLAIDVQIMSTYTSSINYVSYKNKIISSQKQQMKSCKDDVIFLYNSELKTFRLSGTFFTHYCPKCTIKIHVKQKYLQV